jgi:mono/diheme cytochrome c family protein
MRIARQLVPFLLVLLAAAVIARAISSPQSSAASAQQSTVERGRYLVEEVAKCPECHTPRMANGDLDRSRWLEGAAIWIMPVHPTSNWAMQAPNLVGFQGFTEEQGERILEKGVGPNDLPIEPPMHIYHLSHADAVAIIAYLRSLRVSPR